MADVMILESPPKAHTIKGYLGSGFKVVACQGHIRDLPKSKLGVDIDDNFKAQYINIRGRGDLINSLKKEIKGARSIYLATDPDREGEAIAWHLAAVLGIKQENIKRITFNEVTKSAVKEAIKSPRGIDMNIVDAQQARRIIDRIVGYKISPFLWKNVRSGLSAGRVQSVATRLIVEREEEIEAFVPSEYWTITVSLETAKGKKLTVRFYGDANGKIEIGSKEQADAVLAGIDGRDFTVAGIKKSVQRRNPSPPFSTSTLQQEASKRLGFQSAKTMKVAQELYEGVDLGSSFGGTQGLISYMRTDSLRVSDYARDEAKSYILGKYGTEFYPETPREYVSKKKTQDAHEAIRPASMKYEPSAVRDKLTGDQYKLYKLIWDRFTASQMQSALLDVVNVDVKAGEYIFKTSGYTVKFPGFMNVYDNADEDEKQNGGNKKLPELKEGEALPLEKILPEQHFTQPPPRYTEASLIKTFEELGVARPSTYTPTITTIISRGYVEREAKALKPTPLGRLTTDIMRKNFTDIVDYNFTAKIEDDFDDIEDGSIGYHEVLRKFYGGFEESLKNAEQTISKAEIVVPDQETDIVCDKCGKKMVIKRGRFGKFAACPGYPECKNTVRLDAAGNPVVKSEAATDLPTDLKCELCGSPMVIKTGRYNNFYACSNYPACKHTKSINENTGALCPLCGGNIVKKRVKGKGFFFGCDRYPDCKFTTWDTPLPEKCPKCSSLMLKRKGKEGIYCYNKCQ